MYIFCTGAEKAENEPQTFCLSGCLQKRNAAYTIQKCQKMARQNTFKILLLNDANMIEEYCETRMKMTDMCPFEVKFVKNLSQFLPNPGFSSIQVKNCLFSKGHIFGIFILVS